jgi:hypothetical protein
MVLLRIGDPDLGPFDHRVDRVLSFFSCQWNWDSPHPLTRRRVCASSLVHAGGAHSLAGEGGGVVPIPTRGQTLWYSRYICT